MTWTETKLKYLARSPITNGLGEAAQEGDADWPRYIRTTDIATPRSLDPDKRVTLPPDIAKDAVVERGDLLLCAAGSLGKTYLHDSDEAACYAGYLVRFRANLNLADPRFIAYWSQSQPFVDQLAVGSVRSTIDNFSAGKYQNMTLRVPDLDEQRRIADFLDDQVARLDQALDLGSRQVQLLHEGLVSVVGDTVTGRNAARTRGATFAPLGPIPEHWTEARLRSVPCDVQTGPFGSQLHADEYVEGGWPIVNPANIRDGSIIADPAMTISNETRDRLSRHILRRGDVVFGRRGELGRSALVTDDTAGWVCGTGSLRIRFADTDFDSEYLSEFLQLPALKHYFLSTSVGSTMDNLNTSILLNMPLLIPPRPEQREIAERVASFRSEHGRLTALARRRQVLLEERKQALITAAVTGQFDVTAARGEVA
jgi:type I restriction enzyme S subunit